MWTFHSLVIRSGTRTSLTLIFMAIQTSGWPDFTGSAQFGRAQFHFSAVHFRDQARFSYAKFVTEGCFDHTEFDGVAMFSRAELADSFFDDAEFKEPAFFDEATIYAGPKDVVPMGWRTKPLEPDGSVAGLLPVRKRQPRVTKSGETPPSPTT
jgi:hypothetical protein